LVREAQHAESNADFVHKLSIALKEANETYYWLLLLHKTALAEQVHLRRAFKQVQADRFESP
jgi:four helix bundle protein